MPQLNIAICGCGPAGLAAALFLHRLGHHIVLVERFQHPHPIGSGLLLQPGGLEVLDELGTGGAFRELGAPITRLLGKTTRGRVVLNVQYAALGSDQHALGIHRAALFDTLFERVKSTRIDLETGFEVAGIDRQGGSRPLLLSATGLRLGPFDLVVDALGSRSKIAESLFGPNLHRPLAWGALWTTIAWPNGGFDPGTLAQRYARANQMMGILPVGRRGAQGPNEAAVFWSLKAEHYQTWRTKGLNAWKDDARRLWPEAEPLLSCLIDLDQLTFASYGHHTLALPLADRITFIGDAAHATSPQLGQGANMALLDAAALYHALATEFDLPAALAAYARQRRWHVRLYQALGAILTPFYQSDSIVLPAVRDRGFAMVSTLPAGRRLLASLVAGFWLGPQQRDRSYR